MIDSNTLIAIIVSVLSTLLASTGFWTYVLKRQNNKSAFAQMLLGLAHDRIVFLGLKYIERGCISQDEYENLHRYLYKPYDELGGNGSAKRIMDEVYKLPIRIEYSYTNKENK